MDPYLRAVGFTRTRLNAVKKQLRKEVTEAPDIRRIYGTGEKETEVEYIKLYGKNIGIILRGHLKEDTEDIETDSIEAFAVADFDSVTNKYLVEYYKGSPVIVFEDENTGNELVFALQNRLDFYKDEQSFIDYGRSVEYSREKGLIKRQVNFAGFSLYGTIILPVEKDELSDFLREEDENYHKGLIFKYKNGDREAEELLKDYEEETSSIIRQRLMEEDFLSVIEGYVLPMDDTDADYSILGDIADSELIENSLTKEKIYKLLINATGTKIQLFINKKDLLGIPMKGMRFMGNCRLSGSIKKD